MDNPLETLRIMLLAVLLWPLVSAIAVAASGSCCPGIARRLALGAALIHLGLTGSLVFLAADQLAERATWSEGAEHGPAYFEPIAVPGDPGSTADGEGQRHETTWSVLSLTPAAAGIPAADIQLFLGLDGLNVWLVLLTSFMTVIAILVSWESIADRAGAFYGWMFVLQTGIIGAFASFDVILFYVFFELTLIPAFFLIGYWGGGAGRRDAARKFFLYTLLGSLLTLVGVIGVVLTNPTPIVTRSSGPAVTYSVSEPDGRPIALHEGPVTFSIPRLMQNVQTWMDYYPVQIRRTQGVAVAARDQLETATKNSDGAAEDGPEAAAMTAAEEAARVADADHEAMVAEANAHTSSQVWFFVLLMAGFAVKTPIVPFHTWLPAAYGEAPISVTVLLAALMSKLGTFGILRIVLPLTPDAAFLYGLPFLGFLGAAGIIYAAFVAFAQRDIKQLVAYSSVSHLGFIVLGLFALNREGLSGAALHMVNHGLSTGAMFGLLAFLLDRYRTLDRDQYGGLISAFPAFAFLVFVISLANVGLPGLNNFVSEMLMLAGLFESVHTHSLGYGLAIAAASGIFLSAWYTMTFLKNVFFGPEQKPPAITSTVTDLSSREWLAFGLPALLCLVLGLYPQPVLDTIRPDADVIVRCSDQARLRAGYEPAPTVSSVLPQERTP